MFGQGAEVAFHLNAMPELGALGEKGADADGHGRGDGAFAEHDLVDGPRSHADGAGHGVLRNTHGLEVFLQENFAGWDGRSHGFGKACSAFCEKCSTRRTAT